MRIAKIVRLCESEYCYRVMTDYVYDGRLFLRASCSLTDKPNCFGYTYVLFLTV